MPGTSDFTCISPERLNLNNSSPDNSGARERRTGELQGIGKGSAEWNELLQGRIDFRQAGLSRNDS